jgi:signal peptidase I
VEGTEEEVVASRPPRKKSNEYLVTIGATLVVALFLKVFVVEAFRIPSASMENTLRIGDFLFVNKFIYGAESPEYLPFTAVEIPHFRLPALTPPRRGDVIVFEYPGDRDETNPAHGINYIKRCIALPGDTLLIQNKMVLVNGREFLLPAYARLSGPSDFLPREPFSPIFPKGSSFNPDYYGPVIVPRKGMAVDISNGAIEGWQTFIEREGHRVGLGQDSTVLIDGMPSDRYTVERDYLFMMGDNRDNSLDSRFWGFVPEDNVVGKAMFVYWSWDTSIPLTSMGTKFAAIRWSRIGTLIR